VIILTSVKGVFNGSHTDPDTGVLHGHDYEVEAGWYATKERFEVLQARLNATLATIDHRTLPAWAAEDVAPWIMERVGCDQLKLARPSIGHCVTVCES
jgi:hypothetical protein